MSFSLNSSSINSSQINGDGVIIGFSATGSGEIAAIEQVSETVASGQIATINQTVGFVGSGQIASIEQDVTLRSTGFGELVSITQSVESVASGEISAIVQRVRAEAVQDFDIELIVGGQVIPHNLIHGDILVTHEEGDARLMDVTILPAYGDQDLTAYQGKTVSFDVTTSSGTSRIYTGKVDIPEFDLINGKTTLRCTNVRQELNNSLSDSFIDDIGYWSENVFSEPEDNHQEIEQRLETVQASLDYDGYNTPRFTQWMPKSTPDYTLTDSDILYRDPKVTIANRGRVINKVDIELEFQYQRLRHRERDFDFDTGLSACDYSSKGLPPKKEMLRSSIEGAGWSYTDLVIEDIDPSGLYFCQKGDCSGTTKLAHSTKVFDYTVQDKTDGFGNAVTDSNGNVIQEGVLSGYTDYGALYAQSATWTAATRFSQNVSEKNTVSVSAPQSITQYGEVKKDTSFGVVSEYDASEWEDFNNYAPPPSYTSQSANGDYVYNADNQEGARSNLTNATETSVNRAISQIVDSHRENRVFVTVGIMPVLDLHHTVYINTNRVRSKGKVYSIRHKINVSGNREAVTEIELALSRAQGTGPGNSTWTVNRPAVTDSNNMPDDIVLGTNTIPIGGEQDPNWTGYIFKQLAKYQCVDLRTPVAMIVDTPAIEDESRDTKEVAGSTNIEIDIRNDLLEVTYING